ncbi:MAG: hypothetical protein QOH06_3019 [Acidobacteriota bacterium]|nr:hypothetical protein [Acidobacteriota bacterium]
MSFTVSYTSRAREELFDAADYYDLESPGLGSSFLAAVSQALEQIMLYPESAPAVRGRVRRKTVQRFPYSLLYSLRGQTIRIVAVMNQKRRPSYWWGRQ